MTYHSLDNPVFCLAQLCSDKLDESFKRAICSITDRTLYRSGSYIELRIQKTTIFRRILYRTLRNTEPGRWIMTVRFFEDHVTISSIRTPLPKSLFFGFPPETCQPHGLEISYGDPKLMDILLSEMRLAWTT